MDSKELMKRAIALAKESVAKGGGPFGAVIAKDGEIVAEAANRVTLDHDPTAHAEVMAIRIAATKLATHDLSGCDIYASCEPCPMCLGAIYWARLSRLYYAANRKDAAGAGFDDDFIYTELPLNPEERSLPTLRILTDEAAKPFDLWKSKTDRTEY